MALKGGDSLGQEKFQRVCTIPKINAKQRHCSTLYHRPYPCGRLAKKPSLVPLLMFDCDVPHLKALTYFLIFVSLAAQGHSSTLYHRPSPLGKKGIKQNGSFFSLSVH